MHHGTYEWLVMGGHLGIGLESSGDSAHQQGIFVATYELDEDTLAAQTGFVEAAPGIVYNFVNDLGYYLFQKGLLLLQLLFF
jgi:hypothetical protein